MDDIISQFLRVVPLKIPEIAYCSPFLGLKSYLNSFLNNIKLQCYKSYYCKIFGALILGGKCYFSSCVHNNKRVCRLWDTDIQATSFIPLDDDSSTKTRAF